MDKVRKMKIVQLQTSMRSAGRACLRLHNILLERGFDSTIISLQSDKIFGDNIIYLTNKSKTLKIINSKLEENQNRKNNPDWGTFTYPLIGTKVINIPEIVKADVIYLHWILGGFLNYSNLEDLFKLNKPIIIFMHDMWWITGGCHHSFNCKKYQSHCNNCPILFGNKNKDRSYKGFEKKLKLYNKYKNLYFVSPSRWLTDCAKRSSLTQSNVIHYIPNILDNNIFKPLDKFLSRKALNLSDDDFIICFGAESVDSPYKGWKFLKKALNILFQKELKNVSVLIFGAYNKEIENSIPFRKHFVGYLNDEYSLSLVYNAANVFIAPSLAETFGYVILEALSCGTPVVGFNEGGVRDQIKHQVNGYLAKYMDSEDLAKGIEYCMESRIQGKVLPQFQKESVLAQHIELIETAQKKNKVSSEL